MLTLNVLTLPNGIIQAFTYNEAIELLSLTYKKADGTIIEQVSYTYDLNGNPIARNRTQLGSVPETPFTATYDANNRMLTYNGQALSYDANGNLTSRQTPQGLITYTWDAQDRLTGINGPNGTASFKYDYAGRRIEKTINGVTTGFLYDGVQAIAELQGSAIGTTYLTGLQIDEVLARYSNAGNRTLLTDALGSVLAQTDDTQASTALYAYSPYGEATQVGESDNSLQYTGRENDDTGLYYYRARYYDPALKRFISSDPIGLSGGLNTYAYVLNNPLRWTDPLGLAVQICSKFPPFQIPHTFLCVDGNCSGKYPSGNPFASPGEIRDDSDNKSSASCSNVPNQKSDPNCFEQCVAKRVSKRGPSGDLYNYSSANCGQWTEDVILECRSQCTK